MTPSQERSWRSLGFDWTYEWVFDWVGHRDLETWKSIYMQIPVFAPTFTALTAFPVLAIHVKNGRYNPLVQITIHNLAYLTEIKKELNCRFLLSLIQKRISSFDEILEQRALMPNQKIIARDLFLRETVDEISRELRAHSNDLWIEIFKDRGETSIDTKKVL